MFKIEAPRGTWQIDYTFLKNKKINNGFHCVFVAVEIGSRYAYAKATKNIKSPAVKECFRSLLEEAKKTKLGLNYIKTDAGSEFKSKTLASWLRRHEIKHRITHPTYHYLANSLVERFNRTLKEKLLRYMSAYKTKKWLDHLPDIIENYNTSNHSYHKAQPKDVAENQVIQLINRLRVMNANEKLKADPKFVMNKIQEGISIVRIRKKTDEVFAKASNT
jgi:transposase InsO family protein